MVRLRHGFIQGQSLRVPVMSAARSTVRRSRPPSLSRVPLLGRGSILAFPPPASALVERGAGAGVRTLTPLRATEFKSVASACSATPACRILARPSPAGGGLDDPA